MLLFNLIIQLWATTRIALHALMLKKKVFSHCPELQNYIPPLSVLVIVSLRSPLLNTKL